MRSYLDSIRFIAMSRFNGVVKNGVVKHTITIEGEELDSFMYLPGRKNPRGTILVIHGMAARANGDPRLISICRAFASCGYRVISPLYPDIAGFMIDSGTVDRIVQTVQVITGNSEMCPGGKVSLFAPSFSAGMTLIAASHPEVSDLVDSICSIGSYSNVDTSIRFLLGEQDIDSYGRLIVLRNFISYASGFSRRISGVLHAGILDNGLKRSVPEMPLYLEKLNKIEKRNVVRLLSDPGFRMKQWLRILSRSGRVRGILRDLSVVSKISGLKAPVALIHGAGDRVIPASESVLLHERLQEHNIMSRLLITPLISHGDVSMGLDALQEIFRMVQAFAFFFRYAAAGKNPA